MNNAWNPNIYLICLYLPITETMSIPEISAGLNLCDIDSMWDIISTSGVTGEGVYEAMQGLVDMMKIHRREIK